VIFEFEFGEDVGVDEGDGDSGKVVVGMIVVVDRGNIGIVGGESGEDVVVIVEIEGDGVGQCFSP
jgi:hypothetical protein